jgi:hypothetical protein
MVHREVPIETVADSAPGGSWSFAATEARPEFPGRAWISASVVRGERTLCSPQKTVTVVGGEAIPLATTTSVLLPAGVPCGRVNWVEDLVPGATDTEVQLLVRA